GEYGGFVEPAEFGESRFCLCLRWQKKARGLQGGAEPWEVLRWQPLTRFAVGRDPKDVSQIGRSTHGHAERGPRLPRRDSFPAEDQQRTAIKWGCQGEQPGLVEVLGPIVDGRGVGNVALRELCRPALGLLQ